MHRYWSTLRHLRHSPAQLLWFFIGATATVCWLKYKELERSHYAWSHPCIRSSIRLPELPSTSDTRNILKAINDFPLAGSSENQESHWNEENEALLSFGRLAGDKVNLVFFLLQTPLDTAERSSQQNCLRRLLIKLYVQW